MSRLSRSKRPFSRLETEANEKLTDVYQRLLQAGIDRTETEREVKLKETLASLQRVFQGMLLFVNASIKLSQLLC